MTVKPDKKSILKEDYNCEEALGAEGISLNTSTSSKKSCAKLVPKEGLEEFKGVSSTLWSSIYIAAALSFVGSAQFSLYFSSLWPYMQIVSLFNKFI